VGLNQTSCTTPCHLAPLYNPSRPTTFRSLEASSSGEPPRTNPAQSGRRAQQYHEALRQSRSTARGEGMRLGRTRSATGLGSCWPIAACVRFCCTRLTGVLHRPMSATRSPEQARRAATISPCRSAVDGSCTARWIVHGPYRSRPLRCSEVPPTRSKAWGNRRHSGRSSWLRVDCKHDNHYNIGPITSSCGRQLGVPLSANLRATFLRSSPHPPSMSPRHYGSTAPD
jgi:hypothetical protein